MISNCLSDFYSLFDQSRLSSLTRSVLTSDAEVCPLFSTDGDYQLRWVKHPESNGLFFFRNTTRDPPVQLPLGKSTSPQLIENKVECCSCAGGISFVRRSRQAIFLSQTKWILGFSTRITTWEVNESAAH